MTRLEEALKVCQERRYRVFTKAMRAQYHHLTYEERKGIPDEVLRETVTLNGWATFEQVRALFEERTIATWDDDDTLRFAKSGDDAWGLDGVPWGTIYAEVVEVEFVSYSTLTLISSYWYNRAWENPDRGDYGLIKRAEFFDKLAHKALMLLSTEEERDAERERYTVLYMRWREDDRDDDAIFAILKDVGAFV